jgi:hypothetical protein
MSSRNNGASVGSVVKAQMVIEAVASNRSSWRMITGRGLPQESKSCRVSFGVAVRDGVDEILIFVGMRTLGDDNRLLMRLGLEGR